MELIAERLEDLEDDLAARAFLYSSPDAYRDGIEAAFEAVRAVLATRDAA